MAKFQIRDAPRGNRSGLVYGSFANQTLRLAHVILTAEIDKLYRQDSDGTYWIAESAPDGWAPFGQQGPEGEQGEQGIQGPTGATGATGSAGATGSTGPAGATGSAGSNGTDGATWRDGSGVPSDGTGANGDYYLNIANGDVYKRAAGTYSVVGNIKGATGSTGSAGATGATGSTGAAGVDGATWRDGSGAPSNGTGANGDYYLNTANGDVYKRAAGTYSVVGNIKGATGATGSTGSTGSTGATGATGAAGADGNTTNRAVKVLHADKSIANTTHDKINDPGFTLTLVSGHSYKLRWAGRIQCATSSGGAKFRLNGNAVMNFLQGSVGGRPYSGTWLNPWFSNWTAIGDGGNPLTQNSAANSAPGLTAYWLEIEIEVSVATGGTLYLEAAENTNNSALVFKAGFILEKEDTTLTS